MEHTVFPNLRSALLSIRTTVNTHIGEADSLNIYQAHPQDTFELTGRVVRLDSHGSNDYIIKLLVEGEFEPNDPIKYWIPLNISRRGPSHLVRDTRGYELSPTCYTDYDVLCVLR